MAAKKLTWDEIMAESGSWDDGEILRYIIQNYEPPAPKIKKCENDNGFTEHD